MAVMWVYLSLISPIVLSWTVQNLMLVLSSFCLRALNWIRGKQGWVCFQLQYFFIHTITPPSDIHSCKISPNICRRATRRCVAWCSNLDTISSTDNLSFSRNRKLRRWVSWRSVSLARQKLPYSPAFSVPSISNISRRKSPLRSVHYCVQSMLPPQMMINHTPCRHVFQIVVSPPGMERKCSEGYWCSARLR